MLYMYNVTNNGENIFVDYFERIILKNERNVKINIQKCRLKFIHQQLIELDEISITYNVSFLIFLFYYIFYIMLKFKTSIIKLKIFKSKKYS